MSSAVPGYDVLAEVSPSRESDVRPSLDPQLQQKRLQELEGAFAEFAKMSEGLEASYHALQDQVSDLTVELAAARSERLRYLQEKERIANQLARLLDALPGGVVVLDEHGLVQAEPPASRRGMIKDRIERRFRDTREAAMVVGGAMSRAHARVASDEVGE